jgi:hypothetical protein
MSSLAHLRSNCPQLTPSSLICDSHAKSSFHEYTSIPPQTSQLIHTGHALRKQTAGQFGPELARKLSQLVKMEKNVMRSMELVGRERMEVAVREYTCSRSE